MKISFCTTCMNRGQHLQQTLPKNLAGNPDIDGLQVEFVVLNYGDKQGMHEWMMNDPQIQGEIARGRLKYAQTDQEVFRMSHAKNMAHRLASGDVVCNLDADNFTGEGFAEALKVVFEENENVILNPSVELSKQFSSEERGFYGRIALSRLNFYILGGYSEEYSGWGGEDVDLTRRARLLGLSYKRFDELKYAQVIAHTNEDRVANMFLSRAGCEQELSKIKAMKEPTSALGKLWNAGLDRFPVLYGDIAANSGVSFGVGEVTLHNGDADEYHGSIEPLPYSILSEHSDSLERLKSRMLNMPSLIKTRLLPDKVSLVNQDVSFE